MSFVRRCFVKVCIVLSFLCLAVALQAQTIQYWPLSNGDKSVVSYSFNGNSGVDVSIVRSHKVGDQTVYYGIGEEDLTSKNPIIGTQFPGPGVLLPSADGMYGVSCLWLEDLAKLDLSKKTLLLKYPVQKGDRTGFTSPSGEMTATYVVEGFETVTVPAGTYEKSAKVTIHREWKGGKVYQGAFWLAPGVGIVKWQRHTGRIDELKQFIKGK